MSALRAATVQADDATRYLARKLEQAADELQRQAARIRAGDPYQGRSVAVRLAAIEEAHEILDAYQENIRRLLVAGAHEEGIVGAKPKARSMTDQRSA